MLDEKEVTRLRARRVEIGNMLRAVEHAGPDLRLLPQERLAALSRERADLVEQALGVLRMPAYFMARARKVRKRVSQGRVDKALRFVEQLRERLGSNVIADAFDVTIRLYLDDREIDLEDVTSVVRRTGTGVVLQSLLDDAPRIRERLPGSWRSAVGQILGNVALFRDVAFEARSDFWRSEELRSDLEWQRLAVQNPSAPAELLGTLLGCPPEELARAREAARRSYGSERALDVMTEVLREARDPEVISRILDLVDDQPVVRVRFYHVAHRHDLLPAALARRVLQQGDFTLEESLDFQRRNPEARAAAALLARPRADG
jgi:hypothetical protein